MKSDPVCSSNGAGNTSLLSDRLDHHMDISLASPDDCLPLPSSAGGYDPSFIGNSDGPPSTIGDHNESSTGGGSIVGVSVPRPGPPMGIAAQPPVVPPPSHAAQVLDKSKYLNFNGMRIS